MIDRGGIHKGFEERPEDNIVFSLEPLRARQVVKGVEDAPMWSSGSMDEMSWSLSDEE